MLTVTTLLIVGAFVVTLAAALGKAPLWVSVILIVLAMMLQVLPR
jgi:uncharacterized membrane protein YoaK (UPF0700 family)